MSESEARNNYQPGDTIPDEWKEWWLEFEAAAKRPLEVRMKYAVIRTYKPVLDDVDYR